MNDSRTLRELSCADDYDPNSMPVDTARALIRRFLTPVAAVERVHVRHALDRVLACDIVSPLDVPGHDNSAMDGWAVRFADLQGETTLKRVGESFAGVPYAGAIGAGEAVRIFTGAVMPAGADTVVMQERAREIPGGVTIAAGAVAKAGTAVSRGRICSAAPLCSARDSRCGRRRSACSHRSASARSACTASFASRSFPPATS